MSISTEQDAFMKNAVLKSAVNILKRISAASNCINCGMFALLSEFIKMIGELNDRKIHNE